VLSRCLSPHLFIYRNVVKIYVYMWNEFSNELYKIMIKKNIKSTAWARVIFVKN
jgi:hypothetical protein